MANITGTPSDNILTGTQQNDFIFGDAGNDTLNGLGGNDILVGGLGADQMYGGADDDEFWVGGTELVSGEIIDGGTGNNKLATWGGDLSLATISNVQTLGMHLDVIKLSAAQLIAFNRLETYEGAVTMTAVTAGTYDISGKSVTGVLNLTGSSGNDTLVGNAASQILNGGDGDDSIIGGLGADIMSGGAGNDEFLVGGTEIVAGEVIDGGDGNNKISTWGGDLSLATISNVQTLGMHLNTISISATQLAGFNRLETYDGTVTITAATSGIYDISGKSVGGVLNLMGSSGNDTLIGDAAAQSLNGGEGNDIVAGGLGADTLNGNAGADTFVYKTIADSTVAQTDVIVDFVEGTDKIDLTALGFKGITTGTPQAGQLKVSYDAASNKTTIADLVGSNFFLTLMGNHLALSNNDFINASNIIYGTVGNDYLPGTIQQDIIYGLEGNDVLQGLGNADTMLGGDGDDEFLVGFNEAIGDVIDGGSGYNKLSSWNANLFTTTVNNIQSLGLHLDKVTLTSDQLQEFKNITAYDGPATIYAAKPGVYIFADVLNYPNGTRFIYGNKFSSGTFNVVGSNGDDTFVANKYIESISAGDGNDIIYGDLGEQNYGTKNLSGGKGDDYFYLDRIIQSRYDGMTIDGGEGNNTLEAYQVRGTDLEAMHISNIQNLRTGSLSVTNQSQLEFFNKIISSSLPAADINLEAGGRYTLQGLHLEGVFGFSVGQQIYEDLDVTGNDDGQSIITSIGNDIIDGKGGDDYLDGRSGNDIIHGGAGNDRISAGAVQYNSDGSSIFYNVSLYGEEGNDDLVGGLGETYLDGGSGNDTYQIALYPATTVQNHNIVNESNGIASDYDVLNISGAAPDQLWFSHVGNDLVIRAIGTDNTCSIENWYLGASYHVEEIIDLNSNRALVDTNVQNLVNAMASLTLPSTTTLSPEYHAQLDAVIAANWT